MIMRRTRYLFIYATLLLSFFSVVQTVNAASLYLSPSHTTHQVGDTFSVSIFVSSSDQPMNAASGMLSFPQELVEVNSISKDSSILNLWIQEPTFSNSAGTVNFEGIVLNPGFTGSGGKIATITFRAKEIGSVPINFLIASILANDGIGTNILENFDNSFVTIRPKTTSNVAEISSVPSAVIGTPVAPQILSPTHPNTNEWYRSTEPVFTWDTPSAVYAVQTLVDKYPDSVPTVTYSPPISEKKIEEMSDGIWYFHIRLKNNMGWGAISHFKFQIDTEKPAIFEINEIEREDITDPRVKLFFAAKDETSGVDHYKIQLNTEKAVTWHDDGSGVFAAPILSPGSHILIAKAIDKAGNALANSIEFINEALETPVLTEYPHTLSSGALMIIGGTTYPDTRVRVWTQREDETPQSHVVVSNRDGAFVSIAGERLKSGLYKIWAEVFDDRGAQSEPTEQITTLVKQPAILMIGSYAVGFLTILVPLVALIVLLIVIIWYWWHKFSIFKRKLRTEVRYAEKSVHRSFDFLKKSVRDRITFLEKTQSKRELNKEEEEVVNQLKKDLEKVEKSVSEELKNVEYLSK